MSTITVKGGLTKEEAAEIAEVADELDMNIKVDDTDTQNTVMEEALKNSNGVDVIINSDDDPAFGT